MVPEGEFRQWSASNIAYIIELNPVSIGKLC